MTREQLDAIRTNVSFNDVSIHDVLALLEELDRREVEYGTMNATMLEALCAETEAKAEVKRLHEENTVLVEANEGEPWAWQVLTKQRDAALAEVERLSAEVEAKVAQNVALMGMNGRLQQEVERLTAERDALVQARENWLADCAKELRETADDMIAIRKEHERAAFARGVAAMREATALECRAMLRSMVSRSELADEIRALPDPEDAP